MADLIGPFGTASWSEDEWYDFAPAWAPSGIIGSPAASISAGDFAVTASGLTLTVACAGDRAWLDGSGYKPDTNKTNTVTANTNASLSRRDRLVIRRDLAAQTIAVERLTGTAAATPAAPTLTQTTGGVWEAPVCSFLVPPASATTLSGFIDERVWISPDGGAADTGYLSMTPLAASWTVGSEGARYRVLDGVCHFHIQVTRASWSAGAAVFTFPANVAPSAGTWRFTSYAGGAAVGELTLSSTGVLTANFAGATGNAGIFASGTFAVG